VSNTAIARHWSRSNGRPTIARRARSSTARGSAAGPAAAARARRAAFRTSPIGELTAPFGAHRCHAAPMSDATLSPGPTADGRVPVRTRSERHVWAEVRAAQDRVTDAITAFAGSLPWNKPA